MDEIKEGRNDEVWNMEREWKKGASDKERRKCVSIERLEEM